MLVIMCVSDESDSDTDVPRGKVLAAALHLHPGHFSCDCMWQTHFVLHPRLKSSGSSAPRSTISPGWHIASQSVLMALFCWYFLHCYYMHHFTCGISFLLWSISLILFTLLWFISSYKHHLFSVPILTLNISCSASWASHCILTTAWPHITVTCPCSPGTLCHVKSIRYHHHHHQWWVTVTCVSNGKWNSSRFSTNVPLSRWRSTKNASHVTTSYSSVRTIVVFGSTAVLSTYIIGFQYCVQSIVCGSFTTSKAINKL